MKTGLWSSVVVGLMVIAAPLPAAGDPGSCSAASGLSADDARLRCDLDRAAAIRDKAASLYGARFDSLIEIIDTAAPSGAAYVYDVVPEGAKLRLDVRSVPDGKGPRCRLQATVPDDTASELSVLLSQTSDPLLPGYGPREEVTVNPDGSRSLRLVIDSHDIITRAATPGGLRAFSRHAKSDDTVNRLNNLVIGIANVSPGWVCSAAF